MNLARYLVVSLLAAAGGVFGNLLAAIAQQSLGGFTLFQGAMMLVGIVFVIMASYYFGEHRQDQRKEIDAMCDEIATHRHELYRLQDKRQSHAPWTTDDIEVWQDHQRSIERLKRELRNKKAPCADDPIDAAHPPALGCGTRAVIALKQTTALFVFPFTLALAISVFLAPKAQETYVAYRVDPTVTPLIEGEVPRSTATPDKVAAQVVSPTLEPHPGPVVEETRTLTPIAVVLAPSSTPSIDLPTSTSVPTRTRTPLPTPSAQPATSARPGMVLDFESFGAWERGQEPYGAFFQSSERVHEGTSSAKLTYDIPAVEQNYVVFLKKPQLPISGQPTTITAWVYGDGSGLFLNAWIEDSQGELRQFSFGRIEHSDSWQPMVLALDPTAAWPQGHISGPDNGKIDYPIKLYGLVLDGVDLSAFSGQIFIDEVTSGGAATYTPSPGATPIIRTPTPTR